MTMARKPSLTTLIRDAQRHRVLLQLQHPRRAGRRAARAPPQQGPHDLQRDHDQPQALQERRGDRPLGGGRVRLARDGDARRGLQRQRLLVRARDHGRRGAPPQRAPARQHDPGHARDGAEGVARARAQPAAHALPRRVRLLPAHVDAAGAARRISPALRRPRGRRRYRRRLHCQAVGRLPGRGDLPAARRARAQGARAAAPARRRRPGPRGAAVRAGAAAARGRLQVRHAALRVGGLALAALRLPLPRRPRAVCHRQVRGARRVQPPQPVHAPHQLFAQQAQRRRLLQCRLAHRQPHADAAAARRAARRRAARCRACRLLAAAARHRRRRRRASDGRRRRPPTPRAAGSSAR